MPSNPGYGLGQIINEGVRGISDFLRRIALFAAGLFDILPFGARMVIFVIFILSAIGVLSSHLLGIVNNRGKWRAHGGKGLMLSYFCGSGQLQRKLSYTDAHRLLCDRRWSWASFAGLAFRLGNYYHESKILAFFGSLLFLPMEALGFIEMAFRVVIGTVWLLAASLAHRLALLALRSVSYILIPIMQVIDKAWRTDQHCPYCYATFNLPMFICPGCGRMHKQLSPGRSGVLVARCGCGSFVPCALYTGRSRLRAVCPDCEHGLVAVNAKPFSVQLVGGASSGKTAYLAALQHLYIGSAAGAAKFSISGEPCGVFSNLEMMYQAGITEPSPITAVMPYSFVHMSDHSAKHNLVIYDIPGEAVINGSYEKNPRNLGFSDGVIIIIDPLGIAAAGEGRQGAGGEAKAGKSSAGGAGELIVNFVQLFASITGKAASKLNKVPVAVIISKADAGAVTQEIGSSIIRAAYEGDPEAYGNDIANARDMHCRAYLSKLGLDNALNNLDGTFSKIRYFPVSSIGHAAENGKAFSPAGVLAPMAWLTAEARSVLYPIIRNTEESLNAGIN